MMGEEAWKGRTALCAVVAALVTGWLLAGEDSRAGEAPRGVTSPAPRQFVAAGLARSLRTGGDGSTRVTLIVRVRNQLVRAAEKQRRLIVPTPGVGTRRLLQKLGTSYAYSYAWRQERRRATALRQLGGEASGGAATQQSVERAITRLGGRVVGRSTVGSTITAVIPRVALSRLATRRDVQAIEQAPSPRRLAGDDIINAATASGAPAWWAAGHNGGSGSADVPANLAVVGDPIYHPHPAFDGLTFISPPGWTQASPSFGVNGHGTAVLSMAAAQGPTACLQCQPTDEEQRGSAYGVHRVLDSAGAMAELDWVFGVPYRYYDNATRAWRTQGGSLEPAQVVSSSRGADVTADDSLEAQGWDAVVDNFGGTAAVAAGNSGPGERTVNDPALAYNVIGAGAYCCSSSADHTTDSVWSWSSRGPTVGGRKKPDLVAPGDAELADVLYETTGKLFKFQTGTSFAAPQVAAGATLLAGAGIRDPKVVKALLIDSARLGRSSSGAAWGTQTGWQPDFGWGELDLDAAYRERLNFAADDVPANGARFYRATSATAGDRATLVWNRRVADCVVPAAGCMYGPNSTFRAYTLANLDLGVYDATTGARQDSSNSAIDNVEQVRTAAPGDVVYKVTAGGIIGRTSEPLAIAATRPLTPLGTPQPEVTLSTSAAGPVRANEEVTVTAAVANPSADLAAPNAQATLDVPAGVQFVRGQQTQALGTLATRASATATWTVRGTADGLKQLTATATTSVYGTTLTGTASQPLSVDAAPPQVTLAAPPATSANRALAIAWGATDPGAGVAHYDVEVSADGAAFSPWLTATGETSATFVGSAGSRYRFRVRASDRFGNLSDFLVSNEVAIALDPTGGASTGPGPNGGTQPARANPALKLTTIRWNGRALTLAGSVRREATGEVRARWSANARGARHSMRGRARIRAGRFRIALRIPRRARGARRAHLTLTYAGDARFAPATRRLVLRSR